LGHAKPRTICRLLACAKRYCSKRSCRRSSRPTNCGNKLLGYAGSIKLAPTRLLCAAAILLRAVRRPGIWRPRSANAVRPGERDFCIPAPDWLLRGHLGKRCRRKARRLPWSRLQRAWLICEGIRRTARSALRFLAAICPINPPLTWLYCRRTVCLALATDELKYPSPPLVTGSD